MKNLYLKFHLWENVKYKNLLPQLVGIMYLMPIVQQLVSHSVKLYTASAFSSFLYHFRNALYVLF